MAGKKFVFWKSEFYPSFISPQASQLRPAEDNFVMLMEFSSRFEATFSFNTKKLTHRRQTPFSPKISSFERFNVSQDASGHNKENFSNIRVWGSLSKRVVLRRKTFQLGRLMLRLPAKNSHNRVGEGSWRTLKMLQHDMTKTFCEWTDSCSKA